MNAVQKIAAIVRESIFSALAQPIVSIVTMVIVAGMCSSVLLTSGRSVGAQEQVLNSIDAAGTRLIVVRASEDAGLTDSALDRVYSLEDVEWAAAFGPAEDVSNSRLTSGANVALRDMKTRTPAYFGVEQEALSPNQVVASEGAALMLGLRDGVGSVVAGPTLDLTVMGTFQIPKILAFLDPIVIRPNVDKIESVSLILVMARLPEDVNTITAALGGILGADNAAGVQVTSNSDLAAISSSVRGLLGSFAEQLVLLILAVTMVLVATILSGLFSLRRKDFGRRRALGASKSLIISILTTQVAMLALAGTVAGEAIAVAVLALGSNPLPSGRYFVAVGVLALGAAVVSALIPAVIASRRDPLRELRVP